MLTVLIAFAFGAIAGGFATAMLYHSNLAAAERLITDLQTQAKKL